MDRNFAGQNLGARLGAGLGRITALTRLARGACIGKRRRLGAALAGGAVLLLGLAAALPAGAKTEIVLGGASMTIRPAPAIVLRPAIALNSVTIKAGPVTFTGRNVAAPRVVSNTGHFIVGGGVAPQRRAILPLPVNGLIYGCPPAYYNPYGYAYAPPVYGAAGYGVPRYDYRATGTTRARSAYNYLYGLQARGYAPAPRAETLGTFNMPSGYVYLGAGAEARPSFEPRIVQIAGAPQYSGKLPVVHRPAGKNHIHVE